ncbi:Na+/H+ antiporter subunit E [Ancylobacter pratisalsi]|uniref:Na+/H+ antiporter subunit E n=1 Tax=Ancylobacter pratisalsi TaxID=1745854 RepID=A0A6P1YSG4_9HYPH|nr:Na+/H+ antiporter subunit E [Ancylobacter pratisalsi]QIB36082.1 Na+/H+ antiporter subunit E [Ancylobacter pratisalsi]
MARALPHPLLSVVIAVVWILLVNEFSAGAVVLGASLGLLVPLFTARFWPGSAPLKAPLTIIEYLLLVLWDIVVSNVQVAYLILFRRANSLRSQYVTIPLDLKTPEAIAILAGTITMTPGTVSADLSADGHALLVHCLETTDPDEVVASAKARYERRLIRIFE